MVFRNGNKKKKEFFCKLKENMKNKNKHGAKVEVDMKFEKKN